MAAHPEASHPLRLGTRLFVTLAIPLALLIAGFAVLQDHADRIRSRAEVTREGRMIARTVQHATANALRDRQIADVRRLIDDVSGHESVLGVRLYDVQGQLLYAPPQVHDARSPTLVDVLACQRTQQLSPTKVVIGGQPATRSSRTRPAPRAAPSPRSRPF